jgi:serine protease AprX
MAKAKTRKTRRKAKETRVAVLVELRVRRGTRASMAVAMAARMDVAGLQIDEDYGALPLRPGRRDAAALAATTDEVQLVRGTVAEDEIPSLEARPDVLRVWLDTPIAPFPRDEAAAPQEVMLQPTAPTGPCPIPPCDCTFGNPANGTIADVAGYLGVNQIWAAGQKGNGMVIAIVDGGIRAAGKATEAGPKIDGVIGGWPSNWGTTARWGDHGNMTATDALGMAPEAKLHDIRISDASTIGGVISDALQGFQWAIDRHKADGTPHILSNSWGIFQKGWDPAYAEDPDHPFTRKVEDALDEGILVLFAAGNCGQTCPDGRCGSSNGPGNSIWGANGHPRVMTVGAVNLDEKWVGYSSQGPAALDPNKPDFCGITHFAGYFPTLSGLAPSDGGTSAATPIVAGVVALLKQAKSSLTQQQAKNALRSTAKDIGPVGWDQHSGAGIIRAGAAFNSLVSVGLRLIDLEITQVGGERRYSGVFRQGSGGHGLWVLANWNSFVQKWQEWSSQGLRLIDLEITQVGNERRYSGVFRQGAGGHGLWVLANWNSFVQKWQEWSSQGLRLIDLEITQVGGERRYSGVFRQGSDAHALWVLADWNSFVQKWQEWSFHVSPGATEDR